ncbi:MAG: cation diffusion facilitator family transporter [Candidatus Nanopelagicales bacterium]|nr:cation diffusion facilitator family transporter [Candidatus Nanopelagicales bacterium]
MSTEGGTRAVIAAMIANGGIAVTKFLAFLATGSSSMLSEAIHSVADTFNQGLLLLGGKRSQRAPDEVHQFGYGRTRYVYSFMVAIIIFLLGGLFSLYEGWHKWHFPEELTKVWIAYTVLIVSIGLEAFSFRTALRETNRSRGSRSLRQYVRDARQPELPVVLLEDTGALVGLCFALFGITMAEVTGDPRWDGLGAMAIGVLLVIIAVFLAFEMASMLVGESALPEQEQAIRLAVEEQAGVESIIHMRTLHTGPDELLVAVKVAVDPRYPAEDLARMIDGVEQRVRAVQPTARWIFVEPDIRRADEVSQAPTP